MNNKDIHSTNGRFLVRAILPQEIRHFANVVRNDPAVAIVDQIGPASRPHTLVVSMSNEHANLLKQRLAGQFIIEADQPLELF